MKNLLLKTVFLTVAVVAVLAVSVFGIASLTMPAVMMDFTATLGLTEISGDYAFQEFERSGEVSCLVRSFLIAADAERFELAEERYEFLDEVEEEKFLSVCKEMDESLTPHEGVKNFTYRDYVYGNAAVVKYRLAKTEEDTVSALSFAIEKTEKGFPQGNPVFILAVRAANRKDKPFCKKLAERIQAAGFEETALYYNVIALLEEVYV